MGDLAIMTDNLDVVPGVSYNLPPIWHFTGRKRDRDVYGILEYIAQVEEHAGYTRRASESAQRRAKLNLLKTNLDGKAKSYLMGLIDSEKNDWDALTAIYIRKYKTDQDRKAKERAWAEAATIKQRKDESVKAYGERAVRLAQLVASDEGYLVRRFLAGMKDTALRQTLVSGYDDMTSVTVKDLNKKIQNIVGASSQHNVDSSDDEEEAADGDSSDDKVAAKPRMTRAKLSRASSDVATIRDLEQGLRRMEMGSAAAEV